LAQATGPFLRERWNDGRDQDPELEAAVDPSQLDGVSIIVGALAAGAGDGLKDVTKGAVTGAAYSVGQGLQAARDKLAGLLKSRFHGNEDATADLNVYLRRPTPENAEPLAGHILQAGLDHDQQILAAARQLLDAAGPTAIGPGSIAAESISQINKGGGTGFVGGQHVHHHGASTPAPAADWELVHIRGSVFELRNIGSGTAHDVLLDAPGAVRFDPPGDLSAWGPGSGREFFAVGSAQTGHPRLVVRWKNAVSEPTPQSWERPLPQ